MVSFRFYCLTVTSITLFIISLFTIGVAIKNLCDDCHPAIASIFIILGTISLFFLGGYIVIDYFHYRFGNGRRVSDDIDDDDLETNRRVSQMFSLNQDHDSVMSI